MKKVLIITYYWPPAGGSGVQRWLKFVKYFRNFEIEPVVYTVKNGQYPILDNSLISDVPAGIEIIKQPIWEPNTLWSLFDKRKTESAGFLNPNPTFFGKILQYIRANFFIPDARKFWIKPSVTYLKSYILNNKIDVIITTGPPHSMHLIGLKLKQQLGVKWVSDFRDPWTDIDYFHQLPLTKFALKKHHNLEIEVLKNSDLVLVVGNTMKQNYLKYNSNIEVVTNGFDGEVATENKLNDKFLVTHIGLMNADRNSKMLWETIAHLIQEHKGFKNDFKLQLIGKVDQTVKTDILKYQLSNYVEIIDYLPHTEVLQYQKKSQVLLLLVNNVPSAKGIITGKIFEYLMAKRPILAIAPKTGDLAEIIYNSKAGVVVDFDDNTTLKKQLLDMFEQYKNGSLVVHSTDVNQFHRKALTKKVSDLIYKLTK